MLVSKTVWTRKEEVTAGYEEPGIWRLTKKTLVTSPARAGRVAPPPAGGAGGEPEEGDGGAGVGGVEDVAPGPGARQLHRRQAAERQRERRPLDRREAAEELGRGVAEGPGARCEVGEWHRSYTSPLVQDPETTQTTPAGRPDPADEAMCARARERYTADRNSRFRRRRKRHAQLPNLIIIGGLKCGTTSIHHYLGLHPQIQMSKPKELNFFVEELNWDLGLDWYANHFS